MKFKVKRRICLLGAVVMTFLAVTAYIYLNGADSLTACIPGKKIPDGYEGTQMFQRELGVEAGKTLMEIKNEKEWLDCDLKKKTVPVGEGKALYSAEKLKNLGAALEKDPLLRQQDQVIVLFRGQEGYIYETYTDFKKHLEDGVYVPEKESPKAYLEELEKRSVSTLNDKEGKQIAESAWIYRERLLPDKYAPEGYKSLISYVNSDKSVNGHLSEFTEDLIDAAKNVTGHIQRAEKTRKNRMNDNTNYRYLVLNKAQKSVYSNMGNLTVKEAKDVIKDPKNLYYVAEGNVPGGFKTNLPVEMTHYGWRSYHNTDLINYDSGEDAFLIGVDKNLPVEDTLKNNFRAYKNIKTNIKWFSILFPASVLAWFGFVITFIAVSVKEDVSGRERKKIPSETGIVLIMMPIITGMAGLAQILYTSNRDYGNYVLDPLQYADEMIFAGCLEAGLCFLFLEGIYLLCVKVRNGYFLSDSFIRKALCFFLNKIKVFSGNMDVLVRETIFWGIVLLINTVFGFSYTGIVFIIDVAVLLFKAQESIELKKILCGIQTISAGDTAYKVPPLKGYYAKYGEELNSIGDGIKKAVDESLMNEKLKTELIANVSHDIKTPLTSIINYIDILKGCNIEDEKVREYIDILDKKSQRLKVLAEDVVEISRISSGNISIVAVKMDFRELIQQAGGEFAGKFEEANLTYIETLPDEPVYIEADGRRMWRILANIYNNASKYALSGTRVYAELLKRDGKAVFTLKNISSDPLGIDAETLMERFVRGDYARKSEGSGLGLSIARELTEKQDGSFIIEPDGDLFKVSIVFKTEN